MLVFFDSFCIVGLTFILSLHGSINNIERLCKFLQSLTDVPFCTLVVEWITFTREAKNGLLP